MKTRKGTTYWDNHKDARLWAEKRGIQTDRIIQYQYGWAIQLEVSGPYVDATDPIYTLNRVTENGWK